MKNGAQLFHKVLNGVSVLDTQCNMFPGYPVLFAFGASTNNDELFKEEITRDFALKLSPSCSNDG